MLRKRAIRSLLVEQVAGLRLREALLMVGLDWIALAVLFLLRDRGATFLPMDGTIETVFTLGVMIVAIHSGFRLGQLEKYRAVARAHEDLLE
jgi:hypothetical protein